MKFIDLRSDTVTEPTEEMRKAMAYAEVGDDVYDDDPTINALQELSAEITGKEAALFVPSGTFGNQVSILTHTSRGNEVIVDDNAHIIQHEAGAAGVISGVQFRTFEAGGGKIDVKEIIRRIRVGNDIHFPKTALICLENARSDGKVIDIESMKNVREISKEYNIPVHIDGARIFNAAVSLGVDVKELAPLYDSLTFCLSKGLCAPIGSMVVGSREFIEKAKRNRKIMGGGLRQAGILAAAGIIALKDMTGRIKEDHENAVYMAKKLAEIDGIEVGPLDDIQINMVFFKYKGNSYKLAEKMLKHGIKMNAEDGEELRFVTHYWIDKEKIDFAVAKLAECLE